jgi:uncharacterized protein (DUF433 family)
MDLIEQYISVNPHICHGKPCFKGTRIMVWQILELLEANVPVEEIISEKYFPQLTPEHIRAALHLAAEQLKHREFVAFALD